MTPADIWLLGLAVGIALGVPIGHVLRRFIFDPLDRWLDEHWER